jgi:hypothetical protein
MMGCIHILPGSGAAQPLGGLIESREYPGGKGSFNVLPPLLMRLAAAVPMQRWSEPTFPRRYNWTAMPDIIFNCFYDREEGTRGEPPQLQWMFFVAMPSPSVCCACLVWKNIYMHDCHDLFHESSLSSIIMHHVS